MERIGRGGGIVGGVGGAVCGLRGVAARLVERRGVGEAGEVLEGGAEGSAGRAGTACRSSATSRAGLCRGDGGDRVGSGADARAEGAWPASGGDAVYDADGRVGGAAVAVIGAGGGGDRDAGGEPDEEGDRGADRVFRQHAGAADRSIRGQRV